MSRLLLLASISFLSGCTSYQSQIVTETSPGDYKTKTVQGIPIVVTVPQKLGFLVTETTYEVSVPTEKADGTTGKPKISYMTETTIDKTPIALGDSKLIALDVKRPFYGTANSTVALANQYPTNINSTVDDKTLGRLLDSVDKVIQKQGVSDGGGEGLQKRPVKQVQYLLVYDPKTGVLSRAGAYM